MTRSRRARRAASASSASVACFNEIRRVCRAYDDNLVPEPSRRPSDIQEHDFAPAYIAVIGG